MELEKTEPKINIVLLYLFISVIATFVIIVAIYFFMFLPVLQGQLYVKSDLAPTEALNTLRQRETEQLGQDIHGKTVDHYATVDTGRGIYRIPIERAMELEARGSWRRNIASATAQATPASTPMTSNNDSKTTTTP